MPATTSMVEELKQLRASGQMLTPSPATGSGPQAQPGQPPQTQAQWIKQVLDDVGTGISKGAGETAVNLGNVVHHTPVVGTITDQLAKLVGPTGTDPNAAFAQSTDAMGLGADNTSQKVGKVVEQLAEMLSTGPMAAEGAASATFKALPKGLSAQLAALLTHTAAPAAASGVAAGADALLHNDPHPSTASLLAGAGPVVGAGAEAAAPLIQNPTIQNVLSLLAGITGMHAMGGLSEVGLGAGLGSFGLMRGLAKKMMQNPNAVGDLQSVARRTIPQVARGAAAIESQARTH